jgi:mycofactocin glycosyltransferase
VGAGSSTTPRGGFGHLEHPLTAAVTIAGGGTVRSALPALSGLTRTWSPALALGLLSRRTRGAAALAFLASAAGDYLDRSGKLDPVRYTALHVADDLAYGAGVWLGCLRARTARPLLPRIELRSRVWSTSGVKAVKQRL